jgi:hypothetical protein
MTIEEVGKCGTEILRILQLQQVRRAWQHIRFRLREAAEERLMALRRDRGD